MTNKGVQRQRVQEGSGKREKLELWTLEVWKEYRQRFNRTRMGRKKKQVSD
jgi:hypothetical protein